MNNSQYCKHRMARVWQRGEHLWRCRSCGQEMDAKAMKERADAKARVWISGAPKAASKRR